MAPSVRSNSSGSLFSYQKARDVLEISYVVSPVVLFFLFLVAFAANTILSASKSEEIGVAPDVTGPGGKPLPRKRKPSGRGIPERTTLDFSPRIQRLFQWLAAGVLLTLVANAAILILHTVFYRDENWWRGQNVTARISLTQNAKQFRSTNNQ